MGNEAVAVAAPIREAADTTTAGKGASRWWQWILIYPSLAIALVSAAPTWIQHFQAARIGVASRDLAQAQEQNRLWQVNLDCARVQEIQRIKTNRNVEVGAQVCPSGDILLLLKRPEAEQPTFRWVSARTLEHEASLFGVRAAYAAPRDELSGATGQRVISQRWLRQGVLKQRVRDAAGSCNDLVINTYTGSVVSRTPVSCNAKF